MTRLVVHAGTHATGWATTQRQLVSWRAPLERAGVYLHPLDDTASWLEGGFNAAAGTQPSALVDAAGRARRDNADLLLVSSERLEDALRDPERLANLTSFAASLGMPLTVLVVVRDQLGYLNHLYRERVSQLQMARDFASFSADPAPGERFDYATAFSLPIAAPDIDVVVVPYLDLVPGSEGKGLLAAVGVTADVTAPLPESENREALPGPVVIAAKRLLFKRLWRLGLVSSLSRGQLGQAGRTLATHAVEQGWDTHPFWGWDAASIEVATARYGPGNDVLADAVWGRPWGDLWETGEFEDVDLASRDPHQVVDVLRTIDRVVQDLQAAKAAVVSD